MIQWATPKKEVKITSETQSNFFSHCKFHFAKNPLCDLMPLGPPCLHFIWVQIDVDCGAWEAPQNAGVQKQCVTLGIWWLAACLAKVDFQFALTAAHA